MGLHQTCSSDQLMSYEVQFELKKNRKKSNCYRLRFVLHIEAIISSFTFCSYNISFKTILGETNLVNLQIMAPWFETTLHTIHS